MDTLFADNLLALEARSPRTAATLKGASGDPAIRTVKAATGEPVLECNGRVLDSRRDPVAAALRTVGSIEAASPVLVAGFGSGYLAEALLDRGVEIAAIVEPSAEVLLAAMRARDLRRVLEACPVVLLDQLKDKVELACLRAQACGIAPHAPSLAGSNDLTSLVECWASLPVATRVPRVLVVGPIYGGSLEVARSTARACHECGADTRLFDASTFDRAYHALGELEAPSATRQTLTGDLASLIGRAVVAVAAEWHADLVLALAQAPLDGDALGQLRARHITSAFWFVENGRVLPYWRDVALHYDWFYGIQPGAFLERLAEAGARHPRYLPMACDPERHRPLALSDEEAKRYSSDVSFAGAPYLNRRRLLPALLDFNLRIWGEGWNEPVLGRCIAEDGRRFSLDDMVRIFAGSRINLNLHSAEHVAGFDPYPDYVNPRTFELASCGAFQLVDWREPLRELFAEDEMVCFSTVGQLREQLAYYLAHGEERLAIADRSRARALACHTYRHRVEQVLRDALPAELTAACMVGVKSETLEQALARLHDASPQLTDEEASLNVVRQVEINWGLR